MGLTSGLYNRRGGVPRNPNMFTCQLLNTLPEDRQKALADEYPGAEVALMLKGHGDIVNCITLAQYELACKQGYLKREPWDQPRVKSWDEL